MYYHMPGITLTRCAPPWPCSCHYADDVAQLCSLSKQCTAGEPAAAKLHIAAALSAPATAALMQNMQQAKQRVKRFCQDSQHYTLSVLCLCLCRQGSI